MAHSCRVIFTDENIDTVASRPWLSPLPNTNFNAGEIQFEFVTSLFDLPSNQGFDWQPIAPNPIMNDQVNLKITLPSALTMNVVIYNLNGQVLSGQTIQGKQGENRITLDALALDNQGVFLIKLQADGFLATQRILVR